MSAGWPGPEQLRALPANHRRAVAAALRTILEHLPVLVAHGVVALDETGLEELRSLAEAVGGRERPRNLEAVRVTLLVHAEDVAPDRLRGYGPLTGEQQQVLEALAAALTRALAPPRGDGA